MIARGLMMASNKGSVEIVYEEFTEVKTSGFFTWIVPDGVTLITKVVTIGAGGKGGNGNGVGTFPSGGGGGGKNTKYNISVTPGETLQYRVPAGSATTTAFFGPNSTSPFCSASSGGAGVVGTPGAGGNGIVGDEPVSGNSGGQGTNSPNSGRGGDSAEATGGTAAFWNGSSYSPPTAGGAPGAGGGGAAPGSSSNIGAAGGRGEVRITYMRPVA